METVAPRTTRQAALFVATLSSFLGPFMSSSVNVALPSIGSEFSMPAVYLGWVNTAFLLAAATFVIPFGRLSDIYGRKRIFISGVSVLLCASLLIGSAVSSMMIILSRVLQGFGSSMIFATSMPIVVSAVSPEERGRALGITTAAVYFGLSTGPFVGGLITQHLGWRFIFWLNIPLCLILLSVAFFMLRGDWAEARGARFDMAGAAILGLSLLLTMYGFSNLPSGLAGTMTAIGIGGIVLFVFFEMRQQHPILDIGLFRHNAVFAFSNLAALINYAATATVSFLLSLYLQQVKGLSPQAAGLVLISQPIIQAVISPLAGRLSDKIEPRTLASAGMAVTLVGLLLLVFLGSGTGMTYIIAVLMVLGLGFGLFSSPNTNAIMSAVKRESYGVAGATVASARQIGMMFSMGIVMMILSILLGRAEIKPENYPQFLTCMRIAFIVFAVMCFGGIFASLARGKINRS